MIGVGENQRNNVQDTNMWYDIAQKIDSLVHVAYWKAKDEVFTVE